MNLLYTQFITFKRNRKDKRQQLRGEMAPIKQQMIEAYNQIRLEQENKVVPPSFGEITPQKQITQEHAGVNQNWCRIVLCTDPASDSFIPVTSGETCDYFSFDKPCSYTGECCNQCKNHEYFQLKEKYDALHAEHSYLSWRNQLKLLIRGKGFSL